MRKIFRIKEYLIYLRRSKGLRNLHSPMMYEFVHQVLRDHRDFYAYDEVEKLRKQLLASSEEITVTDYGAGAKNSDRVLRSVSDIVKSSVKPAGQAQLLFRIVHHYHCKTILETGTSVGLTTCYLSANQSASVTTLEGNDAIAALAEKNFMQLERKNILLMKGEFSDTLPSALEKMQHIDFIFFDGNHRKEPTLKYFEAALSLHDHSVVVFDDIHWSKEMTQAWKAIKENEKVSVSIDLFYFGILFFRKGIVKQDFIIR